MRHYRLSRRRKQDAQAGFTIAELMAVIVLSTLSVTFIFYLFVDQSRLTQAQQEIGDMQSALQFSVATIARDLRRAGYMSIVTNTDKRLCVSYSRQDFNAIEFTNADGIFTTNAKITSTNKNKNIAPDRIRLFGNFSTTEDFPAYIDPSDSTKIIVNFAGSDIVEQTAFERAFSSSRPNSVNQLIMVKGQTGKMQIVQIQRASYNPTSNTAVLTLATGIPLNQSTACGIAIRFRVAPLQKIVYRLMANERITQTGTSEYKWHLVREVLDPGACNTTGACSWNRNVYANSPNPTLEVTTNAVNLQFWFTAWSRSTGRAMHYDPKCTGTQIANCNTPTNVSSTHDDITNHWPTSDPSLIRSIFFRVTVRSENEDESLPFIVRPNQSTTIQTFDLDPNKKGAARVRSITKNVMVPNMMAR